jgi:hypothetical protein
MRATSHWLRFLAEQRRAPREGPMVRIRLPPAESHQRTELREFRPMEGGFLMVSSRSFGNDHLIDRLAASIAGANATSPARPRRWPILSATNFESSEAEALPRPGPSPCWAWALFCPSRSGPRYGRLSPQ